MNLDALIWIILSVIGAASVAGGIVIYCKSTKLYARALGAASTAAGIVILAIVLVTVPVSQTQNGTPEPNVQPSVDYQGVIID